jgi:hypothetical protein
MLNRSPTSGKRARVTTTHYLALATGSIPLFLIASAARREVKNAINRLALSISSLNRRSKATIAEPRCGANAPAFELRNACINVLLFVHRDAPVMQCRFC